MNAFASPTARLDQAALLADLRRWCKELGFARLGVANIDLARDEAHFLDWLRAGFNGEMAYMSRHGVKRSRPAELLPGTVSCISVRMDYWPKDAADAEATLADRSVAYISRYALGRDYHKVMRGRLQQLCDRIQSAVGAFGYRVFTDSAPVLEMPACPTGAIVAPYRLDARRCISYLTIELAGTIPVEFRRAIGNRIYGCDDCQLVCPWNKFARPTAEKDFAVRHGLDHSQLVELFSWSEAQFLEKTRGSAIRRIGYERWLRNIAVALGNAPTSPALLESLRKRAQHPSPVVREHVRWALAQHESTPVGGPHSHSQDL